jgi:hypothetical protein
MSDDLHTVGIAARVIAAGAVTPGQIGPAGRCRLTLALSPSPAANAPASAPLEQWPSRIEELLLGIDSKVPATLTQPQPKWSLLIAPARVTTGANPGRGRPSSNTTRRIAVAQIAVTTLGTSRNDVAGFWKTTIENSAQPTISQNIWQALANVINQAGQSNVAQRYYPKDDGPQVLPGGHADVSILRVLEHAQKAATRVRNRGHLGAPVPRQQVASDPKLAPPTDPNSPEWKALYETPKKDKPEDRTEQEQARDKEFEKARAERLNKDLDSVKNLLVEAKRVADAQCAYLNEGLSATEAAKQADALGQAHSAAPNCANYLDDCERDKAIALGAALHRLATAPDPQTGLRPANALTGEQVKTAQNGGTVSIEADQTARILLFAVRSYPVLARLFRFVIDVELPITELLAAFSDGDWLDQGNGAKSAFCFLGLGWDEAQSNSAALGEWTVAKATRDGGGALTAFWPATREELDLRLARDKQLDLRASMAVSQLDGVIDLGQHKKLDGPSCGSDRRYDLVSVDSALATELTMLESERERDREMAAQRAGTTSVAAPFGDEKPSGIVSGGLAVRDRWRAQAVAAEIETASCLRSRPGRILDAEDLTIGYRPDVAIPQGPERKPSWRCLMERDIDYRELGAGPGDRIKDWLTELRLPYRSSRRRDLDAAHALPGARRRIVDEKNNKEMVHVQELLASWEGEPMGIAPYDARPLTPPGKPGVMPRSVTIKPGTELAITRIFDIPKASTWPLRYGWAYRVGLRPVWVGGVCLSLDEARRVYDSGSVADLTLPGGEAGKHQSWRRFLRHDPVLAPLVLMPEGIAQQSTVLGRQSATNAILRTSRYDASRSTPTSTWRLLLPPHLSLDAAMRHGAFDARTSDEVIPSGALADIDYDKEHGFPVYGTEKPDRPTEKLKELETENSKEGRKLTGQGEPVFRPYAGNTGDVVARRAKRQFYPDPLAESLVIALRRSGTRLGEGYFDDDRVIVPVRRDPDDFTKIFPVAIAFRAERADRKDEPNQSAFLREKPTLRRITGAAALPTAVAPPGSSAQPGTVLAQVLTFELRPGEAIEVDCWFLPSEAALRRYCELPETLAAIAATAAQTSGKSVEEELETLLPGAKASVAAIAAAESDLKKRPLWAGITGIGVSAVNVAATAQILFRHLQRLPLPEIAAVQTISATQAVDKPVRAPEFVSTGDGPGAIQVYRVADTVKDRVALLDDLADPKKHPDKSGAPGDTGIIFSGKVRFDRNTSRQLELRAYCAFPKTTEFDDPKRGRSPSQQLEGDWPRLSGELPPRIVVPREDRSKQFRTALDLFGFGVASDGRVTLPRDKGVVTLRQFDDFGARNPKASFAGLEEIDLLDVQRATLANLQPNKPQQATPAPQTGVAAPVAIPAAAPATTTPHAPASTELLRGISFDRINDPLARKLILELRATTRFDAFFRRVVPDPGTRLPEDIYRPAGAGDDALTLSSTQQRPVWIFATKRPAKPQVHAVLPAFYEVTSCFKLSGGLVGNCLSRVPRLRVLLDRPWFSSGEGERLALVLWPPRLLDPKLNQAQFELGVVPRQATTSHELAYGGGGVSPMLLADFTDEDLGSGGRFVTRWGADPIRESAGPVGPFLPPSALEDLVAREHDEADEERPSYVARVPMPLRDEGQKHPHESGKTEADGKQQAHREVERSQLETLLVGLATYVPRFDIESEKWFVDLAFAPGQMVEPFIRLGLARYQPHAAAGLQASAPVVAWAQIMPQRTIHVWRELGEKSVLVHAQVSGTYAGRDGGNPDGQLVYPVMQISLVKAIQTTGGFVSERVVGTIDGRLCESRVALGAPHPGVPCAQAKAWYRSFTIAKGEVEGSSKLSVLVEEIEEFLSTDDVDAGEIATAAASATGAGSGLGATAADRNKRTWSGPRMLARVDVEPQCP